MIIPSKNGRLKNPYNLSSFPSDDAKDVAVFFEETNPIDAFDNLEKMIEAIGKIESKLDELSLRPLNADEESISINLKRQSKLVQKIIKVSIIIKEDFVSVKDKNLSEKIVKRNIKHKEEKSFNESNYLQLIDLLEVYEHSVSELIHFCNHYYTPKSRFRKNILSLRLQSGISDFKDIDDFREWVSYYNCINDSFLKNHIMKETT